MRPVYIEGIGVYAPGLRGWTEAAAVLSGLSAYAPTPLPPLKPALLAPDVRRRTSEHIRLAVEVAGEAARMAGTDAKELASIFATAESDGGITHDICIEVAKENPQVSPTKFHNSVTNAPAGYWCMAVGSQQPSTSVSGWDGTCAVGLMEAVAQLLTDQPRVLLVVHDAPFPEPLHAVRPLSAIFGMALVLGRGKSSRSLAQLTLSAPAPLADETTCADNALEAMRVGNPAARALPLLAALAAKRATTIELPYVSDRQGLRLQVEPCV